jgi:catechol-2,3-dioxygenase
MPITRLNHAVLYVRELDRSVAFYTQVLGFRVVEMTPPGFRAAFLQAAASDNDHDLGLFEVGAAASSAGRGAVGLYHLAWEVDTLAELERIQGELARAGALGGMSDHSTSKSLYGQDPDGIEFEIAWFLPDALIDEAVLAGRKGIRPLDLGRERERYGADTPGRHPFG